MGIEGGPTGVAVPEVRGSIKTEALSAVSDIAFAIEGTLSIARMVAGLGVALGFGGQDPRNIPPERPLISIFGGGPERKIA